MENNSESAEQEKLGVCREASGESPVRSVGMLAQSVRFESSPSPTTAFSYVSYSTLSTENQSHLGHVMMMGPFLAPWPCYPSD